MNLLRNRNNVTTYLENKNVYRNLYVSIQNEKIRKSCAIHTNSNGNGGMLSYTIITTTANSNDRKFKKQKISL